MLDSAAKKKRSKGFLGLTWGTWVAAAVLVPVCVMTFNLYRSWSELRGRISTWDADFAALSARNGVLEKVYSNLQNKSFQVCNRTPDPVTVTWLAVAYQNGQSIQLFDSSRCADWRNQVLASGDARMFTLNSQAACNWTGSVVYYAMTYTRESEESLNTINYVGHFKGYDRDCHTIQ
jgi:hypothetical protein